MNYGTQNADGGARARSTGALCSPSSRAMREQASWPTTDAVRTRRRDDFSGASPSRGQGGVHVISVYIHRNGLLIAHVPTVAANLVQAGNMHMRGVTEALVRGARPPAVAAAHHGRPQQRPAVRQHHKRRSSRQLSSGAEAGRQGGARLHPRAARARRHDRRRRAVGSAECGLRFRSRRARLPRSARRGFRSTVTVRRRGNTGLGGRTEQARPPARDSGQDRRRHDHRLPLPRRQRRRADRAVGHGGAARPLCAGRRRPASTARCSSPPSTRTTRSPTARSARIVASRPDRFFGFAFVHAARDRGRVGEMVSEAVDKLRLRRHQGAPPRRADHPRDLRGGARRFACPSSTT